MESRLLQTTRQVWTAWAILVVAALVAACGGSDDGGGSGVGMVATAADLATALTDAGVDCSLEYEGLEDADREFSVCIVHGSELTVSVWKNGVPSDTDGMVTGPNWTLESIDEALLAVVDDAVGS